MEVLFAFGPQFLICLQLPRARNVVLDMDERVVRRRPILRISTAGKTMSAQGTFSRDTTNADKTARVRTTLSIKACNPGCLPLPSPGLEL